MRAGATAALLTKQYRGGPGPSICRKPFALLCCLAVGTYACMLYVFQMKWMELTGRFFKHTGVKSTDTKESRVVCLEVR